MKIGKKMKILNVGGTKVVYHHLPSKLTNIQILTNVGSVAEEKDCWGYAHILEHVFFKGSKHYPGANDIQTKANDIGGKLNAFTWLDVTNYYISVLNDFFRQGFHLLTDMYQHPLFPADEISKELNPILSELRRSQDDPGSYLADHIMPLMIGEQAGHPILGTEETITSASKEKIEAFRARFYGGNNVMLSIVGGVSEEEVIAAVSEMFVLPSASEKPIVPKVIFNAGETKLTKPGITEAIYTLTYPALDRKHPDRYKQSLMTYVLGGNDSGMLNERIREELGMSCYGISSVQVHFDSHSIIDISTGIDPAQLEQCHDEVMGQIKKIATERLDEKRLERAKASLRTSIAATSESSSGYNNAISLSVLKGTEQNPLDRLLTGIEETTLDDITRLAEQTFAVEPYKATLLPE